MMIIITKGGGLCAKKLTKLKVLKKEIITPRISYQWVVQKVISSKTNNDVIRKALTKRYIFLEGGMLLDTGKQ